MYVCKLPNISIFRSPNSKPWACCWCLKLYDCCRKPYDSYCLKPLTGCYRWGWGSVTWGPLSAAEPCGECCVCLMYVSTGLPASSTYHLFNEDGQEMAFQHLLTKMLKQVTVWTRSHVCNIDCGRRLVWWFSPFGLALLTGLSWGVQVGTRGKSGESRHVSITCFGVSRCVHSLMF